jgi:hypothetical protein
LQLQGEEDDEELVHLVDDDEHEVVQHPFFQ